MSKTIKVSDNIWKTLITIKIRDNKKNIGEVIFDLLTTAKEEIEDEPKNP